MEINFDKNETESLIPGITCFLIARSMPLTDGLQEDVVRDYIKKLHVKFDCSPSCYAGAFILLDRFLTIRAIARSNYSIRNIVGIFLISLVVAIKLLEDEHYTNAYYARIGGITLQAFNRAEVDFFAVLGFDLYMCVDEAKATILRLLSHCCCLNSSHHQQLEHQQHQLVKDNFKTTLLDEPMNKNNNLNTHTSANANSPSQISKNSRSNSTDSYDSHTSHSTNSNSKSSNSYVTDSSINSSSYSRSSTGSMSFLACSSNSSSLRSSPTSLTSSRCTSNSSSMQSSPVSVNHMNTTHETMHHTSQLSTQLKAHAFFKASK